MMVVIHGNHESAGFGVKGKNDVRRENVHTDEPSDVDLEKAFRMENYFSPE